MTPTPTSRAGHAPINVNGGAGAVIHAGTGPVSLMAFVIAGGRITHIYSLLDRRRIAEHGIRLDVPSVE